MRPIVGFGAVLIMQAHPITNRTLKPDIRVPSGPPQKPVLLLQKLIADPHVRVHPPQQTGLLDPQLTRPPRRIDLVGRGDHAPHPIPRHRQPTRQLSNMGHHHLRRRMPMLHADTSTINLSQHIDIGDLDQPMLTFHRLEHRHRLGGTPDGPKGTANIDIGRLIKNRFDQHVEPTFTRNERPLQPKGPVGERRPATRRGTV